MAASDDLLTQVLQLGSTCDAILKTNLTLTDDQRRRVTLIRDGVLAYRGAAFTVRDLKPITDAKTKAAPA